MAAGANRDVSGNPGTLDWYLKQHVTRQTANYIAVFLARAGVLELSAERLARVRLSAKGPVRPDDANAATRRFR